jgi:hypothetical protein
MSSELTGMLMCLIFLLVPVCQVLFHVWGFNFWGSRGFMVDKMNPMNPMNHL